MKRYRLDPVLLLTGLVLLLLGAIQIASVLSSLPLDAFRYFLVDVPLSILTILALLRGLTSIEHPEHSRFWILLVSSTAIAMTCSR